MRQHFISNNPERLMAAAAARQQFYSWICEVVPHLAGVVHSRSSTFKVQRKNPDSSRSPGPRLLPAHTKTSLW